MNHPENPSGVGAVVQENRPEPSVKASATNGLVSILRERSTPAAFDAFVDRLPPDTASLCRAPRLATQWLPLKHVAPLYTRAHEDLFQGKFEPCFELGREQLRRDLSTLYRFLLVRLSPEFAGRAKPGLRSGIEFVASRAADLYGFYAKDSGRVVVEEASARSLELLLVDRPFPSPAFFEVFRGSLQGLLEMSRVDNVLVTTIDDIPARHRYRATWS